MEQYTGHKPVELQSINRYKLSDGSEWLTYATVEYRLDSALNVTHKSRSPIGTHPRPQGIYEIVQGNFGKQERRLKDVISVDTVFDIPFNTEEIDKINAIPHSTNGGDVSYGLVLPNKMRLAVMDFDSLRNVEFDVLAHFGRTPTKKQLEDWRNKEGYKQDEAQKIQEALLARNNQGVQERPLTASEVKKMITEGQG